ncbi:hypothetical protein SAMN05660903_03542 [Salegentibacter salinarum]|nr:hypothetical protein SAMN05660903_03542 [Salegentibacter salinarum]
MFFKQGFKMSDKIYPHYLNIFVSFKTHYGRISRLIKIYQAINETKNCVYNHSHTHKKAKKY